MPATTAYSLFLYMLFSIAQAEVQFPEVSIKLLNDTNTIRAGSRAVFNCSTTATTSGITWKHNDKVISSNQRTMITSANSAGTLTLNNFSYHLNGNYTCSASSNVGIISSIAIFLQMPFLDVHYFSTDRSSPRVVNLVVGQPVAVDCGTFNANTLIIVRWERIRDQSDFGSHTRFDRDRAIPGFNTSLFFVEPRLGDSGSVYQCSVRTTDFISAAFGYIQIIVHDSLAALPHLQMLVYMHDFLIPRGDHVFFECIPGGFGSSEVSIVNWTTNAAIPVKLEAYGSRRQYRISAVNDSHQGLYSCVVEGLATYYSTLTLLDPPVLNSALSSSTLTYGDWLSLYCSAWSLQAVNWQWFFNGSRLVNEVSWSLQEVASVTLDHHGTYQCIANNSAGVQMSAAFIQVKVVAASISKLLPETPLAFIGRPFVISCLALGAPPPLFQWFKDDILIEDGGLYNLTSDGGLAINEVTTGGHFKCAVRNELSNGDVVGEDQETTELSVLEPTILTVKEGPVINAQVGTTTLLRCSANYAANAVITFLWSKAGYAVVNTSHVTLQAVDGGLWLYFERVDYEDQGEFKCTVKTLLNGSAAPDIVFTTELVVSDTQMAPVIHRLSSMSPNSIEVQWSFSGNVYGIEHYIIEVLLASKPNSVWTSLRKLSGNAVTKTNVSSPLLTAFTLFNVRVVLSYRDGHRLPSQSKQVRTDIGIPKDAPRDFKVLILDSTSLELYWMPPALPRGPIISYVIRYHNANESNSTFTTVRVDHINYMLTGLQESERLEVQVAAVTAAGMGPFTAKVSPTPKDVQKDVPFSQSIGFIMLVFVVLVIGIVIVSIAIYICKHSTKKMQARNYHVRHSGYFVKGMAVGGMAVTESPRLSPDAVASYMSRHKRAFSSSSPATPKTGKTFTLEEDSSFGGMDYTSDMPVSVRGSGVSQLQPASSCLMQSPSYINPPLFEETIIKSRSRSQSRTSANSRILGSREEGDVLEKKNGFVVIQSPPGISPCSKASSCGVFMSSNSMGTFNKKNMEAGYDDCDNMEKRALESISDGTEMVDDASEYTVYSHLAVPGNVTPVFIDNCHTRLCQPPLGVRGVNAGGMGGSSRDIRRDGTEELGRSVSIGALVHNRLQAQSPMEGLKDYSTYV